MLPTSNTPARLRTGRRLALVAAVTAALVAPAGAAVAAELAPGGTFYDDDGSIHEGYIEAIAAEGITYGCSANGLLFCPQEPVRRGEMAAFLVRALRLPASQVDHFSDDDGHMFEPAVNSLADAGITHGCGDGERYCLDDVVNRGQMAAFLRRAAGLPVPEQDHFSDDDGHMFEQDINAIAAVGITMGCNPPDNTDFCAYDPVTRGQMATFLGRLLELAPMTPPERDLRTLSVEESLRVWWGDRYEQAYDVTWCESRHDPTAVNPRGAGYHGLFQISAQYHVASFERVTGQRWGDAIYTAFYNAQFARALWDQTGTWRAWECKP